MVFSFSVFQSLQIRSRFSSEFLFSNGGPLLVLKFWQTRKIYKWVKTSRQIISFLVEQCLIVLQVGQTDQTNGEKMDSFQVHKVQNVSQLITDGR